MGKRMAKAAGIPPEAVGGKLFRIGGATDVRDVLGAAAERTLKDRGRWGSDVAYVYGRMLASTCATSCTCQQQWAAQKHAKSNRW
jgi:hypothetical protein